METFLLYFLQTSVGMALFYLLYLVLLKNETFYRTNRFFLLGGLIIAFLLPLFPISFVSPIAIMNNSEFFSLSEKSNMVPMESTADLQFAKSARYPWRTLLLLVYLAGLTLFLTRLVWQTFKILWRIRHVGYQIIEGVKVIDWKTTTPFSFFNVVFIDIQEYSEWELSNIIAHEKVHICEQHWVDLLIIELLAVLFWVNPVVWLYERSIKQNHEYLADQGVLLAGYSPGQYQALLINQLMGVKVLGFAHNLNFSLNKKRMEMMKKEKSPGASKMKLLLALPVIALLVFAFAKKEYVFVNEQTDDLASGERYGEIKILQKPIHITGEVITLEGKVIRGAQFKNNQYLFKTSSDATGQFELEIPKGYEYRETVIDDGKHYKKGLKILVNKEGYESAKMLIDPDRQIGTSKIKMRAHITMHGRIINNSNQPLSDATVTDMATGISSKTNSIGEFMIQTTQGHILEIEKPEYSAKKYGISLIDHENRPIEIIMKKAKRTEMIKVQGKVVNSKDLPLTGANVVLKGTNHGTVVDKQGAFVLEVPKSEKPFDHGDITINNAQAIVISFVGYGTHEYVFNTHSEQETKDVKIKLHKASYNVTLPEIGDDEKLIKGTILEFPTPQIGDSNHQSNEEIIEVPAPPKKENKEEEIFMIVEDMPYYAEGGMYQLARDIKKQTNPIMGKTQDRGEVVVGFTITANGNIIDAHVATSSNSKILDASAVKIIQSLDHWRPGVQRGKKVPVDLTVPVNFN